MLIKNIFLLLVFTVSLFANLLKSPIVTVDENDNIATIKTEKIDVGMSGFIVHELSQSHSSILKEVTVIGYDEQTQTATLKMKDFNLLKSNSLPVGKWHVEVGDTAVLAFGYSRAFLIAPSEEVYYRVTSSTQNIEWLHPDIFATILSFNGHPSPQKDDFADMCNSASVGLLFFFLDQKLYTVDGQSFHILNISDAPIKQDGEQHPFYSRIKEIDSDWWGAGSGEIDNYTEYYYELLMEYNRDNQELADLYNKYESKN
jgi:hypothetical protein